MYAESEFYDGQPPSDDGISTHVQPPSNTSNITLQDNLSLPAFPFQTLPNHNINNNPTADMGATTMGVDHLPVEQLNYTNIEQEYTNNNWDSSEVQDDISVNNSHLFQQQQQQNLDLPSCFPPYPAAAPDLLNLLHLPRCSLPTVLPPPNTAPTFAACSDKKPANFQTLDMFGELAAQGGGSTTASNILQYEPHLQLNFCPQPPVFRDHFHSLAAHNFGLAGAGAGPFFRGMNEMEGSGGVLQEGENQVLGFRRDMGGFAKGGGARAAGFTTEKERRNQLNQKFHALRCLIPNPTKTDRASIVGDAIEYIKELLRTVKELKMLVEKKRCGGDRAKRLKSEDEGGAAADMESSCAKPADGEHSYNGSLRSSWLLRKSKDTVVDVRIIDDEVNIKLTSQRKKMNCLLLVAKILHELQLNLLQVAGGNIGDHYIFMFNTKISEGSSLYASAIAKKLIEVLDRQYPALSPAGF